MDYEKYPVYRNVKEVIKDAKAKLGKNLKEFTEKEIVDEIYDNIGTSLTYYNMARKAIKEIVLEEGDDGSFEINILKKIPYRKIVHTVAMDEAYYKDFDDFYNSIMSAAKSASIKNGWIFNKADTLIVVCIFAWYGIEIEDMFNILKTDYDDETHILQNSDIGTIKLDEKCAEFLSEYKNSHGYIRSDGKMLRYKPSKYILRTSKKEQLNKMYVFSYMNEMFDSSVKKVFYDKIYWSGRFYRAYLWEKENGVIYEPIKMDEKGKEEFFATLDSVFGKKDGMVVASFRNRYREFRAYKKFYYNE